MTKVPFKIVQRLAEHLFIYQLEREPPTKGSEATERKRCVSQYQLQRSHSGVRNELSAELLSCQDKSKLIGQYCQTRLRGNRVTNQINGCWMHALIFCFHSFTFVRTKGAGLTENINITHAAFSRGKACPTKHSPALHSQTLGHPSSSTKAVEPQVLFYLMKKKKKKLQVQHGWMSAFGCFMYCQLLFQNQKEQQERLFLSSSGCREDRQLRDQFKAERQ